MDFLHLSLGPGLGPPRHRTDALELAEWMGDRWGTRRFESGVGGGAERIRESS